MSVPQVSVLERAAQETDVQPFNSGVESFSDVIADESVEETARLVMYRANYEGREDSPNIKMIQDGFTVEGDSSGCIAEIQGQDGDQYTMIVKHLNPVDAPVFLIVDRTKKAPITGEGEVQWSDTNMLNVSDDVAETVVFGADEVCRVAFPEATVNLEFRVVATPEAVLAA